MIGKTVPHYRITGNLGAGGMWKISRAEDANLHGHVAIKVLPDEFAHDMERPIRQGCAQRAFIQRCGSGV
jgi:hypothetical protein